MLSPPPWNFLTAVGLDCFAAELHSQVSANPDSLLHTSAFVLVTRHPYKDEELGDPAFVKIDDPNGGNLASLGDAVRDTAKRLEAMAVAVMIGADESLGANDEAVEQLAASCKRTPPRQLLFWVEHRLLEFNGRAWSAPLTWDAEGCASVGPLALRDCAALPPDGPLANLLPQRIRLDS